MRKYKKKFKEHIRDFKNKLDAVDGVNPATKHKMQTVVLDTIEKIVYPAYREIIKYLKNLESVSKKIGCKKESLITLNQKHTNNVIC